MLKERLTETFVVEGLFSTKNITFCYEPRKIVFASTSIEAIQFRCEFGYLRSKKDCKLAKELAKISKKDQSIEIGVVSGLSLDELGHNMPEPFGEHFTLYTFDLSQFENKKKAKKILRSCFSKSMYDFYMEVR